MLAVCLNDYVDFVWQGSARTGYRGMISEPTSTYQSFQLSEWRRRFAGDSSTLPLSRHDDASLLAWQPKRVRAHLKSQLLPFGKGVCSPVVVLVVPSCQADDLTCLDASEWLQNANPVDVSELYLPKDALHFSEEGHQRLAVVLGPELKRHVTTDGRNPQVSEGSTKLRSKMIDCTKLRIDFGFSGW